MILLEMKKEGDNVAKAGNTCYIKSIKINAYKQINWCLKTFLGIRQPEHASYQSETENKNKNKNKNI